MKPFSTYPEERAKLLALCTEVDRATYPDEIEDAATKLASFVRAILEDEAPAAVEAETTVAAQIAGHALTAKQSTENILRANALEQAGKHLAVKLAEVYRAARQKPAECQAIREWMAATTKTVQP